MPAAATNISDNRRFAIWLPIGLFTTIGLLFCVPHGMSVFASGKNPQPAQGRLYGYSTKRISGFLESIGYSNLANDVKAQWDITRNSDGTALRIFSWRQRKGIVVACDGTAKEIALPGSSAWFDDHHRPVAWLENNRVYHKTGLVTDPPFQSTGAEPGGRFFLKSVGTQGMDIFSSEEPEQPLTRVDICALGSIYAKGTTVYVFGLGCPVTQQDRDEMRNTIVIRTFELKDKTLVQSSKKAIQRPAKGSSPFYVKDFCPWKDEALVVDVFDWPSSSDWYTFDLATGELKKAGKSSNWGFYLQCDILDKVTRSFYDRRKGP